MGAAKNLRKYIFIFIVLNGECDPTDNACSSSNTKHYEFLIILVFYTINYYTLCNVYASQGDQKHLDTKYAVYGFTVFCLIFTSFGPDSSET